MSGALQPRPGFDWTHVTWGKPDSPRSALCSYCSAGIADDEVPLMMWKQDGSAAQFCDACMKTWWGMEPYPPANDDDYNELVEYED